MDTTFAHSPSGCTFGRSGFLLSSPFEFARVVADGSVTFTARVSGEQVDYSNDQGVWGGSAGTIGLMIRKGAESPGGGTFESIPDILLDVLDDGAVLHRGYVDRVISGQEIGNWIVTRTSGIVEVAVTGDLAPGAPATGDGDPAVFANISLMEHSSGTSASVKIVFTANTDSAVTTIPDPGEAQYAGVWRRDANGLGLYASQGAFHGETIATISSPFTAYQINSAGTIALGAKILRSNERQNSIWIDDHLVAVVGDEFAPGVIYVDVGVYFWNDSGHFLLQALTYDNSNDEEVGRSFLGSYENGTSSLEILAYSGMAAPGISSNQTILDYAYVRSIKGGDVLFSCQLEGSGTTYGENDEALWFYRSGESPRLIVRKCVRSPA